MLNSTVGACGEPLSHRGISKLMFPKPSTQEPPVCPGTMDGIDTHFPGVLAMKLEKLLLKGLLLEPNTLPRRCKEQGVLCHSLQKDSSPESQ